MPLVDHLDELRKRLIFVVGALVLGSVIGWFLYRPVFNVLTNPFCAFMTAHPTLAVDPSRPCSLVYLSVVEPFTMKIKVAIFTGLVVALPFILTQLWRFVTPALKPGERRFALPFVLSSLVLFSFGAWFAMLTLPRGLAFLLGFAGTERMQAVLSISRYLGFVTLLILAFGASFEFPLLLVSLCMVGVLSSQKLRKWRRYALVMIAVFAAVITPSQDWFTMTAMMVPLIVFYEVAILVTRALKR